MVILFIYLFFAVIHCFSVSCPAEPVTDLWPQLGLPEVWSWGSKLEGQRSYSMEE